MENNCLKIEQLTKGYRDEVVLREVNLEIQLGESVAITGSSGSGKSTLLHLIGGLLNYQKGSIRFKGREINQFNEQERCVFRNQCLGFVYQKTFLLKNLTVLENTLLPLKISKRPTDHQHVIDLLEKLGLSKHLNRYYHQLSGGEGQRVAIARALVTKPVLVLADEPTGNLDYTTSRQVLAEFLALVNNYGSTLLMVTHDLEIAKRLKKHYALVNGRLQLTT